ncbi:MAG: hypothetical protein WCT85_03805 [Parachlamydiales bacterium]
MSQSPSGIPPAGHGPKPEGYVPPANETKIPPQESEGLSYLNFTFTDEKSYLEFKGKFLANMVNEMVRQIKSESERMVAALKKLREDNQ